MMHVLAVVSVLLTTAFSCVGGAAAADVGHIAGTTPDRRPEGAPVSTAATVDKTAALRGIAQPVPPSLRFIDDHGGWYTPFTRPGMPPPYDPRGLHRVEKSK